MMADIVRHWHPSNVLWSILSCPQKKSVFVLVRRRRNLARMHPTEPSLFTSQTFNPGSVVWQGINPNPGNTVYQQIKFPPAIEGIGDSLKRTYAYVQQQKVMLTVGCRQWWPVIISYAAERFGFIKTTEAIKHTQYPAEQPKYIKGKSKQVGGFHCQLFWFLQRASWW